MTRKNTAFTLIEMVIVVCIMALLAGIAVPVIGASLRIGETQSATDRMQMLAEGIANYFEDTGLLPTRLEDLTTNGGANGWCGPYVNIRFDDSRDDIFFDAWRNRIEYMVVDSQSVLLRSWGYNGRNESGEGDDIDLRVSVAPLLRCRNLQLLAEINHAIQLYNRHYRVSPMSYSCFTVSGGTDGGGDSGGGSSDGPPGPPPWAGGSGGNPNAPGQGGAGDSSIGYGNQGNSNGNYGGSGSFGGWIGYDGCNHTVPNSVTGHWHTHWYLFNGQVHSHTHRHDLNHFHCLPVLHPGQEHLVEPGMNVIDVPLKGPWAYTLELLETRGLLDNSDGRYTVDAWGNSFITGPDPVQYVGTRGSE